MNVVLDAFALLIVANLLVGCIRLLAGPRAADRMLTAQLFGTLGVALLLVLAERQDMPALRHVALVFALLALLTTATFARRAATRREPVDS
jgi:multicomponent Na+:H+ antiporter subunit F